MFFTHFYFKKNYCKFLNLENDILWMFYSIFYFFIKSVGFIFLSFIQRFFCYDNY